MRSITYVLTSFRLPLSIAARTCHHYTSGDTLSPQELLNVATAQPYTFPLGSSATALYTFMTKVKISKGHINLARGLASSWCCSPAITRKEVHMLEHGRINTFHSEPNTHLPHHQSAP